MVVISYLHSFKRQISGIDGHVTSHVPNFIFPVLATTMSKFGTNIDLFIREFRNFLYGHIQQCSTRATS